MSDAPTIRPARLDECDALSALARRSKAHWGYDDAFLARCADELRVSLATLAAGPVGVCDGGDAPLGFYALDAREALAPTADLALLFVEPAAIGRGIGARLLRHALEAARARGRVAVTVASDPYAEDFYRAMGAERVGEVESTVTPGRMLPLLRLELAPDA